MRNQKSIIHAQLVETSSFIISLALFLTMLASFYIPYLLDPEFTHTVIYLEARIKPGLLYNNLNLLSGLDKDYSSHFYLPILTLGIVIFTIRQGLAFPRKWHGIGAGLGLLLASTLWLPDMWKIGSLSLALLPWLLLGLIWICFSPSGEIRTAWIMFGVPLLGYVFLVDDPRTHLYIIYPGAVLLAGAGWDVGVGWLAKWKRGRMRTTARVLVPLTGLLLIGLIIIYTITIFLQKESTWTRLQQQWAGSNWEFIYDDLPQIRGYFGYPKREGWKAIGALRAQGQFPGDFRSVDEDFIIPIWYNYGQARSCYNTPAQFFVRSTDNPSTPDEDYVETGQVQREGEVRLHIFSAGVEAQLVPPTYSLENFEARFDQLATPQQFTHQAEPAQEVGTQFGSAIKFVGYDLPTATIVPGETLYLDLYWQALANPEENYRAFVHLTDGTTLWGQQDDDPACRLPTSTWRAGQYTMGQFRLPLNPDTPLGRYSLIIGLYQADTLERLKITSGVGQPGDDFLWLRDIEVENHTVR